ncbi:MAG: amidohydrolase family protein [Bacteroidota bacterium]
MRTVLSVALALFLFNQSPLYSQVIDVHLHSYTSKDYWGGRTHPTGITSPTTAEDHLKETIAEMDKNKVEYAVISGSMESISAYTTADARFIPGYMDDDNLIPIREFEQGIKDGKIKVFGEITAVYGGTTLNDPKYAPYLELCETYDIPVAYHTGGGPPMTPYRCCPNFRISYGDPFLIEDVLVKYPKLRLYLMHGGEVFFEHAVRMMSLYQQLYIDIGVLLWVDPIVKDYAIRLLKLAKEANVLDRVMFGSDQMVWPGSISASIDFLNQQDYLTAEEKHLILSGNAKRFLKIEN